MTANKDIKITAPRHVFVSPAPPGVFVSPASPGVTVSSAPPDDERDGARPGVGLLTRTRLKPKKPAMFRVLLLNDDFTPMDFVVHVLEKFFAKNRQEATEIMLHVHRRGVGVCGVYTYEVAETKVNLVMDYARKNEHPLQCTMEKE
jgi:ATP-dependent Clp protease adaptor protein ClpS